MGSSESLSRPLTGDREPGTEARFRWTWFALLCAAVFLLLVFRQPNVIWKPSFVAEDGFAFFKQSYEEPFWRIIFRPQTGYLQTIPRLVAQLGGLAPLESIPLAYALAALILATGALTFLALPSFRTVIRSDALRAVIVLVMPFMPNADAVTRVSYLHWYGLFFLVLVTLMPLPKGRVVAGTLWAAAALVFCSHPVAILCLPVVAYRLWRAGPGAERRWWIALLVVGLLYPFTVQSQTPLHDILKTPGVPLSVVHAVGYRVFCFFVLGQDISRLALAGGWFQVSRLSLFCLCVCAAASWSGRARSPRNSLTLAFLSYYILLVPVPYISRTEIIPDFLEINEKTWLWHQRYFYVSVLLLCVFCGVAYQQIGSTWKHHAAAGVLLLCWLGLHATTYRMWDFQSHPGWPHFARHIRSAEERVKRTGVGERIAIQTSPFAFELDVGSPAPSAEAQW